MVITPFQVSFYIPEEESEKKTVYSVPDLSDIREMRPQSDGSYVCHTHDRLDSEQPSRFFQVVFRITDSSPFIKEELKLSLEGSIFQGSYETIGNDLFHDKKNDLWYQRTQYKRNKDGDWELKSKVSVESITASGVFKICVFHNGRKLTAAEYEQPWVYVLPSTVTKEEYILMLSDLLELNERLVRRERSSIGLGGFHGAEEESTQIKQEIADTEELQRAIKGVMGLSSELIGKKHVKSRIERVHHFDAKTLQDYVKYGMTGRVSAVEYYEDHDTYENRCIRTVLERVRKWLDLEKRPDVWGPEEIAQKVDQRLQQRVSLIGNERLSFDREKAHEEIYDSVCTENEKRRLICNLFDSRKNLSDLLDDKWFKHVQVIEDLSSIRMTPKFSNNRYYSQIYKLITGCFIEKPFISASFDINSFGVAATNIVYEYWVFYKIITRLMDLGFTISSGKELKDHFNSFLKNQKLKPLRIPMQRTDGERTLKIELGYNLSFSAKMDESTDLRRTPDYYLKVIGEERPHWYFFDAKYKSFRGLGNSWNNPNKIDYIKEIQDVAVTKYIDEIGRIFETNPSYKSTADDIRGSYIIMADIDEARSDLSLNNRLFGAGSTLNDSSRGAMWDYMKALLDEVNSPASSDLPRHRFGGIELKPENDDELNVLFQMIFEYLETDNNKEHQNLGWCWNCDSALVDSSRTATIGGNRKYYTTCPSCGDTRVITNCPRSRGKHLIIKHTNQNFHTSCLQREYSYEHCYPKPWAFYCPECGEGL